MKATLVGPGAIGGAIASQLIRKGVRLSLLATERSARRLAEDGLRVVESGRLHRSKPRVAVDAAELGVQDVVILCLKSNVLPRVARELGALIGKDTTIVAAQNGVPWWFFEGFDGPLKDQTLHGIDPDGHLQASLPPRQCVGCLVYMAARMDLDGLIHSTGHPRLVLGEAVPTADGHHVRRALDVLRHSELELVVRDDVRREVWLKLLSNLAVNPISALTGSTVDMLLNDPSVASLARRLMKEALQVARALGIDLDVDIDERLASVRALGAFKTSMLQDLEAGRPLEVESIVGAVAEIGARVDVDTPFTQAILGLLRHRAASAMRGDLPLARQQDMPSEAA